jgi:hypothetical protein
VCGGCLDGRWRNETGGGGSKRERKAVKVAEPYATMIRIAIPSYQAEQFARRGWVEGVAERGETYVGGQKRVLEGLEVGRNQPR